MTNYATTTIGVDVGDQYSQICVLDDAGEVIEESRIRTRAPAVQRYFGTRQPGRVVLETGTHSPWMSRQLGQLGHEVLVANARRAKLISENHCKSDEVDAELLARLGRADPKLLAPVVHRKEETQAALGVLRQRDSLVHARVILVNTVRGQLKSLGHRLPNCSTASFAKRALAALPAELSPVTREALQTTLAGIRSLTQQIKHLEKQIAELCENTYPETQRLMQVPGVGPMTALAFVLTLENPMRFANARAVGPYLGLVPRRRQTGNDDPALRISKAGNGYLRALLVQCAHCILGRFGADTALRQWGLSLLAGGGRGAKKRAVVAVARKLAVVLYRLWVSGEKYEPWPDSARRREA